jgi:hypothetical protein
MQRASEDAGSFNRKLARLSDELAAHDIVVSRLHADWASFGCWELQVQRGSEAERYLEGMRGPDPMRAIGPQVLRCFWDGLERHLRIEASPTRAGTAPNEWRQEHAKAFNTSDEAMQYLAEYLERRLPRESSNKA